MGMCIRVYLSTYLTGKRCSFKCCFLKSSFFIVSLVIPFHVSGLRTFLPQNSLLSECRMCPKMKLNNFVKTLISLFELRWALHKIRSIPLPPAPYLLGGLVLCWPPSPFPWSKMAFKRAVQNSGQLFCGLKSFSSTLLL